MNGIYHILITTDFPPEKGGIQRCLYVIYKEFPPDSIMVIAPYSEGAGEFDKDLQFEIKRIGRLISFLPRKLRMLFFIIFSFLRIIPEFIKRRLIERRFLIIHCGHIYAGICAKMLLKFFRLPYIVWTYAVEIMDKRRSKVIWSILKDSSHIIAISDFTKEFLLKGGIPENKIKKVRLPLTFSLLVENEDVKRRYGLEGKRAILTVARLTKLQRYKGIDVTIESIKKVKEEIPDVVYIIAGDGDGRREYEEMVEKLNLMDTVIFAGRVSDEELSVLYQSCDVFVMPSRVEETERGVLAEGFGLVFLEANYFCKPVIGGEGGCRDAIIDGRTGFIVNPRDPDEIASKIIYLLKNPDVAKRMGEEGRIWAESVKPEDVKNVLLNICEEIIPKR